MDSRSSSWAKTTTRLLRSAITILVALVLLNEGLRYSEAWLAVLLSARDVKAAIGAVVATAPDDRDGSARAAQSACARHGVKLETYGHRANRGAVGLLVVAELEVSRPVKGLLFAPAYLAVARGETPASPRPRNPTIRFGWHEQYSRIDSL